VREQSDRQMQLNALPTSAAMPAWVKMTKPGFRALVFYVFVCVMIFVFDWCVVRFAVLCLGFSVAC